MVKLDKANVHIRVDGEDLEEYKVEESYTPDRLAVRREALPDGFVAIWLGTRIE